MYLNKFLVIIDIFFLINFKCIIYFVFVEFKIKKFLKINIKMLIFLCLVFICLFESIFDEYLV